jgi:SAM-dependent methyltransferase
LDVFAEVLASCRPALRDAAVAAASELGLFESLVSPLAVPDLGRALRVKGHRRLRALTDLLVFEGLLARGGEGRLEVVSRPAVRPVAGQGLGWDALAQVIRSDEPLSVVDSTVAHQQHLLQVGERAARQLFEGESLSNAGGTLLDIGSGAGAYARAFLQRSDENRVVLVDSSQVLALARNHLSDGGQRVAYVEGDYLDVCTAETAKHVDVALLANVLHLHGEATCRALVAAAGAALVPGGVLVVKDLPVFEDRGGPAIGLYFAVNMALYTIEGDVHTQSKIAGWMAEAGLDVQTVDVGADAWVFVGRCVSPARRCLVCQEA